MSDTAHIASAFDRDLEGIQALVMRMGGLVEAAIQDGARALYDRDEELAAQVRANDKHIDALERQVNEECARVLALRQPIASDLRIVLSVMKLSGDLERIGDYAKNMGKRATLLAELDQVEGAASGIRRMARGVAVMLNDVLDAYVQKDVSLAAEVRERDAEIDQMYNSLFREFITHMLEDPRNITAAMHFHFIAKNLERMGDHVTNIAEQVIYMVDGAVPDEARAKADDTSVKQL